MTKLKVQINGAYGKVVDADGNRVCWVSKVRRRPATGLHRDAYTSYEATIDCTQVFATTQRRLLQLIARAMRDTGNPI